MTIQSLPINLTEVESEFAKPCQGGGPDDPCVHPAEWMIWSTHSRYSGCPGTWYICGTCKDFSEKAVAEYTRDSATCRICHGPFASQVSDNLRFIHL